MALAGNGIRAPLERREITQRAEAMEKAHPIIQPQPGVMEISPYVGGAANLPGISANQVTKLSSNENPLGPSPKAKDAFIAAAETLERYPDGGQSALRTAIANAEGLPFEQLVCGNGSDELISLLCSAYTGPGDEVLLTEHGFEMYKICARAAGATPIEVAEKERVADVDALLAACNDRTRLVFIANPNNPTGTFLPASEIERLADGVPETALLVIDGAYAEYVEGYDGGASLVLERDNVVMTRTFSKIHGLGGLRVGWGLAPPHVIDVMARVRAPFNVNAAALAAAEAAIQDRDYLANCRSENARLRARLADELANLGLPSDPSEGNFILIRFDSQDRAVACDAALKKRGIIVRLVAGYGLPNCLRITVGDELACQSVVSAIQEFMST